jgi:membrane peptidoglycan carboxypeptidase
VLSTRTAEQMKPMLASVFDRGKHGGTAHGILLPGYRAGAKTGTAHKLDPATGRYADHPYLASFAGFAPLDDPRVLVLVLIDEPHPDEHFGGQVAGPPWLEVMTETLRYLGVVGAAAPPADASGRPSRAAPSGVASPQAQAQAATAPAEPVEPAGDEEDEGDAAGDGDGGDTPTTVEMPDLAGVGLADALEMAGTRCASVQVRGSGRVIEQFPSPGRRRRPAECRIVLSHETGPRPRSPQ